MVAHSDITEEERRTCSCLISRLHNNWINFVDKLMDDKWDKIWIHEMDNIEAIRNEMDITIRK